MFEDYVRFDESKEMLLALETDCSIKVEMTYKSDNALNHIGVCNIRM